MDSDLTVELTQSLAAERGVEPTEVEETLHEHIDLEALERLSRHESGSWLLSFELPDHTVTVTSDRQITLNGHQKSQGSSAGFSGRTSERNSD